VQRRLDRRLVRDDGPLEEATQRHTRGKVAKHDGGEVAVEGDPLVALDEHPPAERRRDRGSPR
jgi:hypothetical protein